MKRTASWVGWLVAICLCMMLVQVWAQQAPPAPPPGTPVVVSPAQETQTTFWGLVRQGGIIMFPLGLLSVAMIALVVYGFILTLPARMLRPDLVPRLQEALSRLDLEGARQACSGVPSLMTNVLTAGLQRISGGVLDVDSMEKAMEEASVEETTAGMKPISYLSIVAQTAPMLGLLGTVSGMIKAFQKIGLGGMGDPERLAADIGEAMVTTATGLIIGIPAMFFYFFLKSRYMTNVSAATRVLGNLAHHLVDATRRAGESGEAAEETA